MNTIYIVTKNGEIISAHETDVSAITYVDFLEGLPINKDAIIDWHVVPVNA